MLRDLQCTDEMPAIEWQPNYIDSLAKLLAPMNRDYENFARTNPPSITLESTNDVAATLPHPK